MCGCVKFSMPSKYYDFKVVHLMVKKHYFKGTNLDPICNPDIDTKLCCSEVDLIMTAREFQSIKLINETLMIEECNCLPTCTAITYNSEISQAAMTWKQYINGIQRRTDRHFDKYFFQLLLLFFDNFFFLVFNYRS